MVLAPARLDEDLLYIAANMEDSAQHFELPRHPDRIWYTALDTGAVSPTDLVAPHDQVPLSQDDLVVRSRSVVVLEGRSSQGRTPPLPSPPGR
jgi:isoamylase